MLYYKLKLISIYLLILPKGEKHLKDLNHKIVIIEIEISN